MSVQSQGCAPLYELPPNYRLWRWVFLRLQRTLKRSEVVTGAFWRQRVCQWRVFSSRLEVACECL